ncbi:MAG: T9SS type A sorting domain-containing protein [Bacteroidales bacterium]|nr:T9SS type A sorting domain-containing protein [Bacteroidales bacterium]
MKKSVSVIILLLSFSYLMAQNYSFSVMPNPDAGNNILGLVFLKQEQAFAFGANNTFLYHNGSAWFKKNCPSGNSYYSFFRKKSNGDMQLMYISRLGLYSLNDDLTWQKEVETEFITENSLIGVGMIFYNENNAYLCSKNAYDDGEIWHYNGVGFEKKTSHYKNIYYGLFARAENNLLLLAENINQEGKLFRFTGGEDLLDIFTFPANSGFPWSFFTVDSVNFFILTDLGDIWLWNDDQAVMAQIYSYDQASMGKFNYSIFAINSNTLISSGSDGIRSINVSTGQAEVLYSMTGSINSSAYQNGRAIFVGGGGLIIEMLVANAVSSEEIDQALKIYPNPANTSLNVEFPVFGIEEKTLQIFDLSGKKKFEEKFSSFQAVLDISDLSSGLYLVKLFDQQGNLVSTKKLVKE